MGKKIKKSVEIIFTVNSEYKEIFEKCVRTDMGNMNYKSVVMKGIRKSHTSRESRKLVLSQTYGIKRTSAKQH